MAENAQLGLKDDGRICHMAGHEATVDDLYRVQGKAELVGGELVLMTPTSWLHGYAVIGIAASLREHGRRTKRGQAFADNVGFLGAPVFAVEVRSDEDYGPVAERAMAAK